MEIRPACEPELSELFRIQLQALGLTDMLTHLEPGEVPAYLQYDFDAGDTIVAVEDGRLVGFAVSHERDGTWFLGEFFVLPGAQSAGIGQALLTNLQPSGVPCATMSTSDYRAQALYARCGMTPRWPSFNLRGSRAELVLPSGSARVVEASCVSPAMQSWDAVVCGRRRPEDLRFLLEGLNGTLLWIERHGQRIGYAGFARRSKGSVSIGPIGVRESSTTSDAVMATVAWAVGLPGVETITLDVPGPHPALGELLAAGFRIMDQNLFCASDATRFGDPARYLPLTPAFY